MKTMLNPMRLAVLLIFLASNAFAQTNTIRHPSARYGIIPIFTNNPAAMFVISNLLAEPPPALAVPAVSQTNSGFGTYWTLKGAPVPLPFNPYPDLDVYQVSTNNDFIIDDRSVDYQTLAELEALEAEAFGATNSPFTGCATCALDESGLLWIEVPTNSLATPDYFTVAVHNTVPGQTYDILTTPNLLAPWVTELVVTGAAGNITPAQVSMSTYTNKFVRARTSVSYSFYLITAPLSQDVLGGDTVTFYVETGGNTNLTFQWTFNGNAISGATNSIYTISLVRGSDIGEYACIISDGINSLVTTPAQLNVVGWSGDLNLMEVVSARQNYTFKSGMTYLVGDQIRLYGKTTIEAGAVIKVDWYFHAGLVIMGTLDCKGEPYYPAVMTSVDDDSIGYGLGYSASDPPLQPIPTGVPYLELACDKTNVISNLRIEYADWGVTTPTASRRLDVWDCQFVQCNYGVVNLVTGSSTNSLHNVLFAWCGAALGAATNAITVEAEQVTADVSDFCLASVTPNRMALTNCIIWGSTPTAGSVSSVHVALNPNDTNFASSGAGIYYLAASSSLHQSGATNISSRLRTELQNKTTFAPVAIAPFTQISGQITLSPQAQRYTNGLPDIGYHYDALDYTVADLILKGGTLTVLPGTAVGFRMDLYTNGFPSHLGFNLYWTYIGLDVRENSTVVSQGMPGKPNVFVDVQQVQEQFQWPVWAGIVPNYFPTYLSDQSPALDFRFSNFYLNYVSYMSEPALHFWSGIDLITSYEWSIDSAMNLTLQDCKVRGGQISLGTPDNPDYGFGFLDYDTILGSGAVAWNDNLFDNVSIYLNPTYYWYNQTNNCDLQITAYNNLFKNSTWLILVPNPATAGNWTFRDNLFDKAQFYQDPALPLDFDHNGYWPLPESELLWGAYGYTNQLQATATSDGTTEVFLTNAPPYQRAAFGNYYLSQTTPLYRAGSRTATDAGLTQYTTFTNQSKDASNQPVNIGLHYVAATNSLPLDSDGDGVPDFVEVEHGTDLNNQMTDGVTNDAYSSVYDTVDLSGSGLDGFAKKVLGVNPLDSQNPLFLKRIITGNEPVAATFEVPVSYDTVTDAGFFHLHRDGFGATGEQLLRATNGNCLLVFNQYFDPPGSHLLHAHFQMGDQSVADGPIVPFFSSNKFQFGPSGAMFDDYSAYLDAKVFSDQADYVINLYDTSTTNEIYILSITNTTTTGLIQEDWGMTNANGTPFTGMSVRAEFSVTPAGATGPTSATMASKPLQRATNSLSEWGLNFNVAYMYTPTNGALSSAFVQGGAVWNGMQGVVDYLIAPRYSWDHYNSDFNRYLPDSRGEYPGYLTSRAMVTNNLYPTLTGAKQFYCYSHGASNWIGNWTGDTYMKAGEIGKLLNNSRTNNVIIANNPYRFVFLDGCSTASTLDWQTAFGIADKSEFTRNQTGPQAYVGWAKPVTSWMAGNDNSDPALEVKIAQAYTKTLQLFYLDWMNKVPLATCIDHASLSLNDTAPLPVRGNENCLIIFSDNTTYQLDNGFVARIIVVGHPGLKVDGVNDQVDARTDYAR
jgi:hypothetical protein